MARWTDSNADTRTPNMARLATSTEGSQNGNYSRVQPSQEIWSSTISKPKPVTLVQIRNLFCLLDGTLLDVASLNDPLPVLTPNSFVPNATGLCMLTRDLFAYVHKVRGQHALLVVLAGRRNEDLSRLGLADSCCWVHWMFILDPRLQQWSRKLVTSKR